MTFHDDVHRPPSPAPEAALPVREVHAPGSPMGQDVTDDAPPVLREVPTTTDPALNSLLAELSGASELPLEDQLPIIEAVHRGLQDRLADTEG